MKKLTQTQKEILAKVSPEINFIMGHSMYGDQAVKFFEESDLSFFFTNGYFIKHNLIKLRKIEKAQNKSEKMNFILNNYFDKKPIKKDNPLSDLFASGNLKIDTEKAIKNLSDAVRKIKAKPFVLDFATLTNQQLGRAFRVEGKELIQNKIQEKINKDILSREFIQEKDFIKIGDKRFVTCSKENIQSNYSNFAGEIVEILEITKHGKGFIFTVFCDYAGYAALTYTPKLFGELK